MPRYVVLPAQGFTNTVMYNNFYPIGSRVFPAARPGLGVQPSVEVLDSIHEDGPKLVEMTEPTELNLRLSVPGIMVVPVVYYQRARAMPRVERGALPAAGPVLAVAGVRIRVRAQGAGIPVPDVRIIAFTNFERREGEEGVSDEQGEVALRLRPGTRLQRLYAFPETGFWGILNQEVVLAQQHDIELRPIALDDAGLLLRRYYGMLPNDAGSGVIVGVVDSGIAPKHPALNVTGGLNMVFDETGGKPEAEAKDWGPARIDGAHGTHVAGIVGGHPTQGWRGVAPGVSLRSYRVFPHTGGGATNYDITKAIDRAANENCDIVNLSLGGSFPDQAVRAAIDRALAQGVLVIVANGNDGRGRVAYPAAWPTSVAVSAMGRRGSFPADSPQTGEVAAPFGEMDPDAFIAQFSNIGPEVDVTGPGVGIVSTVPDDRYGVMDGTSMACPAVAGFAAYLLATNQHILNMRRDEERSRALKELLFQKAQPLGFGRNYEGFGLSMEALVA